MAEKTEQPTAKKLRDARKKGQVANSKDVTSTALLIVIFAYFGLRRDAVLQTLSEMTAVPALFFNEPFQSALQHTAGACFLVGIRVLLPLVLLVFLTGIMANTFQFGLLFAPESIKPDFNKLNPMSKLKQIFSLKNLIEFLKSAAKILFLSTLLYFVKPYSRNDTITCQRTHPSEENNKHHRLWRKSLHLQAVSALPAEIQIKFYT